MQLLAAAWAVYIKDEKRAAAAEVERLGKLVHGDEEFQEAVARMVGESGTLGKESG